MASRAAKVRWLNDLVAVMQLNQRARATRGRDLVLNAEGANRAIGYWPPPRPPRYGEDLAPEGGQMSRQPRTPIEFPSGVRLTDDRRLERLVRAVYCDPNYGPEETYPFVDSLLLIRRRVFLYAPSGLKVQAIRRSAAHGPVLSIERLKDLVALGFVVPTALAKRWDRTTREAEADRARKDANRDREEAFAWTELDDFMLEFRDVPTDEFVDAGERLKSSFPETHVAAFEAFKAAVWDLRERGQLPLEMSRPKYRALDADGLARHVLFMFGADAYLAESRGADIYCPPPLEPLYEAVAKAISPGLPTRDGVLDEISHGAGSPMSLDDEVRFAGEVAKGLVGEYGPLPTSLLKQYHSESRLPALLRFFINESVGMLRESKGPATPADVVQRFKDAVLEREQRGAPTDLDVIAAGVLIELLGHDSVGKLCRKVCRRGFLLHTASVIAASAVASPVVASSRSAALSGLGFGGDRFDPLLELIAKHRPHKT